MHRPTIFVYVLGLTAVVLDGCSGRPFSVGPEASLQRELEAGLAPAQPDTPRPRLVALCYNGVFNSDAAVLEEAALTCPGALSERAFDWFWNGCPLLQPTRVTYACTPEAAPAAPRPAQ